MYITFEPRKPIVFKEKSCDYSYNLWGVVYRSSKNRLQYRYFSHWESAIRFALGRWKLKFMWIETRIHSDGSIEKIKIV